MECPGFDTQERPVPLLVDYGYTTPTALYIHKSMSYNNNYFGIVSQSPTSSAMSAPNQNTSNSPAGVGHSSYRGRGRGNGNRNNYGGGWSTWKKATVEDRVPLAAEDLPKGSILEELEVSKLVEMEQSRAEEYRKVGYEILASYNWVEKAGKSAIIVPGKFSASLWIITSWSISQR